MAALTPMDIETVEFKKTPFKGYSAEEVDLFLDKIIMEFERLYKDNAKLQDKLDADEEVIKHYKNLEETIKSSIVRAEKTAEETVKNANTNAQLVISNAQEKAEHLIDDACNKVQIMLSEGNEELARIKLQVADAKAEYVKVKNLLKNMLTTQMNVLESSTEDFEAEAE
ncbi:MAG: DivIVA domain-containing protein [Clostridia bacterium]|nr:DivIVA domain-containing protein [Clostridia bacterium]